MRKTYISQASHHRPATALRCLASQPFWASARPAEPWRYLEIGTLLVLCSLPWSSYHDELISASSRERESICFWSSSCGIGLG
ncbi:hypothetical protein BJY01DRAFT_214312 [Aspergillus pseudoustus]|uniref:Uncharacterized protein n=1 Tax=Aspergillus pseudoustus TaxID=1810923 RepID=A0ABR4JZG4_9EURO